MLISKFLFFEMCFSPPPRVKKLRFVTGIQPLNLLKWNFLIKEPGVHAHTVTVVELLTYYWRKFTIMLLLLIIAVKFAGLLESLLVERRSSVLKPLVVDEAIHVLMRSCSLCTRERRRTKPSPNVSWFFKQKLCDVWIPSEISAWNSIFNTSCVSA